MTLKYLKKYDELFEFNSFKKMPFKKAIEYIEKNCKVWKENYNDLPILFRTVTEKTDYSIPTGSDERVPKGHSNSTLLMDSLDIWKGYPRRSESLCLRAFPNYDENIMQEWTFSYTPMIVIPNDNSEFIVCSGSDFNYADSWIYLNGETFQEKQYYMILRELYAGIIDVVRRNESLFSSDDFEFVMHTFKAIAGTRIGDSGNKTPTDVKKAIKMMDAVSKEIQAKPKTVTRHPVGDSFYQSGKLFSEWLSDLMSPIKNKFVKTKYTPSFSLRSGPKEVYTTDSCIMVRVDLHNPYNSPYSKILQELGL